MLQLLLSSLCETEPVSWNTERTKAQPLPCRTLSSSDSHHHPTRVSPLVSAAAKSAFLAWRRVAIFKITFHLISPQVATPFAFLGLLPWALKPCWALFLKHSCPISQQGTDGSRAARQSPCRSPGGSPR